MLLLFQPTTTQGVPPPRLCKPNLAVQNLGEIIRPKDESFNQPWIIQGAPQPMALEVARNPQVSPN